MNEDSYFWAEPLLDVVDRLYQTSDLNAMVYDFFVMLGKLIPFDAAIFNPINWKTLELQEGFSFVNTPLNAHDTQGIKFSYDPLHFDLLCLTQLNVTFKLPYTAANRFVSSHQFGQQPSKQRTLGVIAGWHQYPVAAIRLFRLGTASDFSNDEIKLLDRLAVHLGNAVYLKHVNVALESIGQTGLIVFDSTGKVLYKNCFVSNLLAKKPLDSILHVVQNGGTWWKHGKELYRLENIPLTQKSLLASYAKKEKPAGIASLNNIGGDLLTTQGITIISIKPFQRRTAIENRLKRNGLSRREIDVTLKVMCGLSNSNIAKQMHIDETTVKDHLQHIYAKIHIKSRTELISKLLGLDIELANHDIPIAPDTIGSPHKEAGVP